MRTPPQALADQANRRQWVAWGRPDAPKMPINPHTGGNAMPNNPQTWGTLPEAIGAVNRYNLMGVGLVTGQGLGAIDLDHVIGPDGQLHPDAAQIMETMDSYTELSMSGTGLHILFGTDTQRGGAKRDLPGETAEGQQQPQIEMYSQGHYIALTGNVYGPPKPIKRRTAQANVIYRAYLTKPAPAQKAPSPTPMEAYKVTDTDRELLDKMFTSSKGARIRALWGGDTSEYGNDTSKADQALCNYLAYWTNNDTARMDSLFRQSGLYHMEGRPEKWDRNAGQGKTYGQRTIEGAVAATQTWAPKQKRKIEHGPLSWDAVLDD